MTTPEKIKALADQLGVLPRDVMELGLMKHNLPKLKKLKLKPEAINTVECNRAQQMHNNEAKSIRDEMIADQGQNFIFVYEGDPVLDPQYNERHPLNDHPTLEVNHPPEEQPSKAREGRRYAIFGYPVTAVLRFMGTDAWTVEDAHKVVTALGCPVAIATVRAQVCAGRNGQRGDPAKLTSSQVEKLYTTLESL